MSEELGPIDIVCDSPPYPVVKACRRLGFQTPQDVRWCRAQRRAVRLPCSCGQALAPLESYTFTFESGRREVYFLAQCLRCRAIHWDQ